MKSDELMLEYKAQKMAAQIAALDEARAVKSVMALALEDGLSVWLGEFYDELESAGAPGEFEFHPGGNYEADAQLKLWRVWRGIGVQVRVTASKKRGAYTPVVRALKAEMKFVWEEERLWGKTQYRKEIAVNLPFKETDGQDKWFYVAASAPVEVKTLGEALVEALAVEAERSAVREQVAVEREENNKLAHERGIEGADDFTELLECYEKAMIAFANDAARWKAAYEQRTGELGAKLADEEQFAEEVFQANTWLESWKAILEANREKLRQVQAQWAHPLKCYALEYGIVAEDEEDGEVFKYAKTEAMYVADDDVDECGCWKSLEHDPRRVRVIHPVRVFPVMFAHKEAPKELLKTLWVPECLEYIRCWTGDDVAEVKSDLLKAQLVGLPKLDIRISEKAWSQAVREGNYAQDYSERVALSNAYEDIEESRGWED